MGKAYHAPARAAMAMPRCPPAWASEDDCLEFELRAGKQHGQKDTPALLARVLNTAHRITDQPLLLTRQLKI